MRAARRPGSVHAIAVIARKPSAVVLYVSGSVGATPTSMLDSVRKYGEAGQLRLGKVRFSYLVWNLSAK